MLLCVSRPYLKYCHRVCTDEGPNILTARVVVDGIAPVSAFAVCVVSVGAVYVTPGCNDHPVTNVADEG